MSEGMRGERGGGAEGGAMVTFRGTRDEAERFVRALEAVIAGATVWVGFGLRRLLGPGDAPAEDFRRLTDAVTRLLAVGSHERHYVSCRFKGARSVTVEVTSDDGAPSAPRGGVGASGDADGVGVGGGTREGTTTAGAVALAMREVMVEFGCDAINARRGIARAFGMVLPGELWAGWVVTEIGWVTMVRGKGGAS